MRHAVPAIEAARRAGGVESPSESGLSRRNRGPDVQAPALPGDAVCYNLSKLYDYASS